MGEADCADVSSGGSAVGAVLTRQERGMGCEQAVVSNVLH